VLVFKLLEFFFKESKTVLSFSTIVTDIASLDIASNAREPLPAKRSKTLEPLIENCNQLNRVSFTDDLVGLSPSIEGNLNFSPLNKPELIRNEF